MADEKKISTYQERLNNILKALRPDQAEEFDEVLEPILVDAKKFVDLNATPAVSLKSKHYTKDFWTKKNQHFEKILAQLNNLLLELPENTELALRNRLVEVIAIIGDATESIESLLPKLTMQGSSLGGTVPTKKHEKSMHEPIATFAQINKQEKKEKKSIIIPAENKLCSPFPVPANQRELASILDRKTKLDLLYEVIPTQALNCMVLEYDDPVAITFNEVKAKIENNDKNFSLCNFSPMDSAGCYQPIDLQAILTKFGENCFVGAKFTGALLNEIDLSGFLLEDIDFTDAVLKGARLKNCEVRACRFVNAVLSHARLHGSIWDDRNVVNGAILDRVVCDHKTNLRAVNLEKITSMHFFRFETCWDNKLSAFKGDGYFADAKFLSLLKISLEDSVIDDDLARSLLFVIMQECTQGLFNKSLINLIKDALNKEDSEKLNTAAKELTELGYQKFSIFPSVRRLVNFLDYFEGYTGVKASTFLNYYAEKCSQFRPSLTLFNNEKPEWFYGIQLAVKEGNKRAQYILGLMYEKGYKGYGLKRDIEEAVRLYYLAYWQGEPCAALALGFCYQYGHGVEKDLERSFNFFMSAQTQHNIQAEVEVGKCYFSGLGVAPNAQHAFISFHNMVEAIGVSESSAKFALGRCYELGQGVGKNLKKAIDYYQIAAKDGNTSAQYKLGELYELGVGFDKSWPEAIDLYQKAAALGDTDALFKLGRCYQYGYGVDQDLKEAFRLYQLLAEMGNANGQLGVGYCYEDGMGVKQDLQEAFKFYQLAAAQKHPDAQYEVAYCYEHGRGVDQDFEQAFKFYQHAAENNNDVGQYKLGYCYEFGMGVDKNLKKAHEYYERAAQAGNGLAQLALGKLYEFDQVEKDLKKGLTENINEHLKEATKYYWSAIMKQKSWLQYALIQPPNITNVAKYLTKAIELCRYAIAQGGSGTQAALGHCYAYGLGVAEDLTRAVKLFQLAADQNNRQAQCLLGLCYEIGRGVAKDLSKAAENYRHALEEEPKKSIFASSAVLFPPPSSASSSSAQPPTSTSSFAPGQ